MARNYNELEKRNIRIEIEKALLSKDNWKNTCKRLGVGKDLFFQEAKQIYAEKFPEYLLSKEQIVLDYLNHKDDLVKELRKLRPSPQRVALENKIRQEVFDSLIKIGVLPSQPEISTGIIKVIFDDGDSENKV
jgi:hypothetical protein